MDQAPLQLDSASFVWPGTSKVVLKDITVRCPVGVTLVCGKVGTGKTALLQALLGEMDTLSGKLSRSYCEIGYCSQTPWLQSMSIKENITFFAPDDDDRYRHVLEACALTRDLATFKDGDLSDIGEKGIGLSGGQKMRVALARAVYSRAKILLLDDPLSALDQETAESIVQKCFSGPLMKDRVVVLVTHRTDLCEGLPTQILEVLDEGQVRVLGQESARLPIQGLADAVDRAKDHGKNNKDAEKATPRKFQDEEKREHGDVRISVYWEYMYVVNHKQFSVLALERAATVKVQPSSVFVKLIFGQVAYNWTAKQERSSGGL